MQNHYMYKYINKILSQLSMLSNYKELYFLWFFFGEFGKVYFG